MREARGCPLRCAETRVDHDRIVEEFIVDRLQRSFRLLICCSILADFVSAHPPGGLTVLYLIAGLAKPVPLPRSSSLGGAASPAAAGATNVEGDASALLVPAHIVRVVSAADLSGTLCVINCSAVTIPRARGCDRVSV